MGRGLCAGAMMLGGFEHLTPCLQIAKRIDLQRAHYHPSGYMPIIYTTLGTGMKRNELLALEWKDVDLQNGKIHITKSLRVERFHIKKPRLTQDVGL